MDQKRLLQQRERRARTNNETTKKYEKTKSGKLMRSYRNMISRVKGIQVLKSHLYAGKAILEKQEFYDFSFADKAFNDLYDAWVLSNFDRKLAPSIDRIDTSKGYTLENIRWITHSENSKLGAISRHQNKNI